MFINVDIGVLVLLGMNGFVLEALGDNAYLLRDFVDVIFEDVESWLEKCMRMSVMSDVRECDIVCIWFDLLKNVESFYFEYWYARLREKFGVDVVRFFYRIVDVDIYGYFIVFDYVVNDEDEDV